MPDIKHNNENVLIQSPRSKSKCKAQQQSIYFLSEDNFTKLTVKERAQLYTQFINSVGKNNLELNKHDESMKCSVKEYSVLEKQKTVKVLLKEYESQCTFPRQYISSMALEKISKFTSKETHEHTKVSPKFVPLNEKEQKPDFKKLNVLDSCHKRCNDEMHTSLPIEAFAPPRKIRRTECEKLLPKILLHDQNVINLFLNWLSEKGIKEQINIFKETDTNAKKLKFNTDKLLEEATAKLEALGFGQNENFNIKVQGNKSIINKPLDVDDSESGVSSLTKITSDESQADKQEIGKTDYKPLRKKKLRRYYTCTKNTIHKETKVITSTDSETDNKTKAKNKMLFGQIETDEMPIEPTPPQKFKFIKNLTFFSPTVSQKTKNMYNLDKSAACIKHDSACFNDVEGMLSNKVSFVELTNAHPKNETQPLADNISNDQGFETGSYEIFSPIRFSIRSHNAEELMPSVTKLNTMKNLSSSTPIKEQSSYQQLFSPITKTLNNFYKSSSETESRRSSWTFQCKEIISMNNKKSTDQSSVSNSATLEVSSNSNSLILEKKSQFWIRCADISVSLDIEYYNVKHICLLHEKFRQNSSSSNDLHFGIDNQMFSVHKSHKPEKMSKYLSAEENCSYYWFSIGDYVASFRGKFLPAVKIQRLFEFIKSSVEDNEILRFGVDAIEFSKVYDFHNQLPNISMDSNYSLLVGLQSGNSNGLEGRNKFAWPYLKPVQVSNLEQMQCWK